MCTLISFLIKFTYSPSNSNNSRNPKNGPETIEENKAGNGIRRRTFQCSMAFLRAESQQAVMYAASGLSRASKKPFSSC